MNVPIPLNLKGKVEALDMQRELLSAFFTSDCNFSENGSRSELFMVILRCDTVQKTFVNHKRCEKCDTTLNKIVALEQNNRFQTVILGNIS